MSFRWKSVRHLCVVASLTALAACQGDSLDNEPVDDTGIALDDASPTSVTAETLEITRNADVAAEFTGHWDPETGFHFEMGTTMLRGMEFDPVSGELRTAQSALGFCPLRATAGRPDTIGIAQDPASFGTHLDGPTGACGVGAPPLSLAYDHPLAAGATCADIGVVSYYQDITLTNVHAMITEISSETNRAYTFAERNTLGLGTGAEPPVGTNAPTDAFGGLFAYGDIAPSDTVWTQWVLKNDGQPFSFSGVVTALFEESCNGIDDDCDGVIDEENGCYTNGTTCESDADCASAFCDPSIRQCDGSLEPEICDNGIDDNADGNIDCADRKCSGVGSCVDFGCANGNLQQSVAEFDGRVGSYSAVSGTDAQIVAGELTDFELGSEQCGSTFSGAERVFAWQAPSAASYTVTASSSEFDVSLVVVRADSCAFDLDLDFVDGDATCADDIIGLGTETMQFETTGAGDNFYIMVGTANSSNGPLGFGSFELVIEKVKFCGDDFLDAYDDLVGTPLEDCDGGGVDTADCNPDCTLVSCNDGYLNSVAEGCEDGNTTPGDGCSDMCQTEAGWECLTQGAPCAEVCGDGLVVGDEACDDNDVDGGDGCSVDCRDVETGWTCDTPGADCEEICGDSLRVGDEACDDGGTSDGDGCTQDCLLVEAGYRCPVSGGVCTDIDECAEDTDNCSDNATCGNTNGSFTCTCLPGYSTTDGGVTCDDVDECADPGLNNCGANTNCLNNEAGFACECQAGYEGDAVAGCTNIDECAAPALNNCGANSACTNLDPNVDGQTFSCSCAMGYEGDPVAGCTDVDECADPGLNNCGANSVCSNTTGGFDCACASGYEGDPVAGCTNIDECSDPGLNNCGVNTNCTDLAGSFTCDCIDGYEGDAIAGCTELNECANPALNNCAANTECTNLDPLVSGGTFFSCACAPGYEGDPLTGCTDVNECDANPCDANATCTNNPGGFVCECDTGFSGDGFTCGDVNECLSASTCHPYADCTNTTGSFTCECLPGTTGDGLNSCANVDECSNGTAGCGANSACADLDPSVSGDVRFTCTCDSGYGGDPYAGDCTDIDECADNADDCDAIASCSNTIGGFDCSCPGGYTTPDSGRTCNDIDECSENTDDCQAPSSCSNLPGDFECVCPSGYDLVGGNSCQDIDECATGADTCDDNFATCQNTVPGFGCTCISGRETADGGQTCTDIDECSAGLDSCADDGITICNNLAPSNEGDPLFACSCPAGYRLNAGGTACVEIDECAEGTDLCDDASTTCRNLTGGSPGYACDCRAGFDSNNGTSCQNINECNISSGVNANNCHGDASCVDVTPTSANGWDRWDCACNTGYNDNNPGDPGTSCSDFDECAGEGAGNTCGAYTLCVNTVWATNPGRGYQCDCQSGYTNGSGADPYAIGCFPICGNGSTQSGHSTSDPDGNNEACDDGAQNGVIPACESRSCSYCTNTCDIATVSAGAGNGCRDGSDNDSDGDTDCDEGTCSVNDSGFCGGWACNGISDRMTGIGSEYVHIESDDYTCRGGSDAGVLYSIAGNDAFRRLRVETSSSSFDTVLYLDRFARACSGACNPDASNDDGGSGLNSRIDFDAGASGNQHTFMVEGFSAQADYNNTTVSVSAVGCQANYELDCNNTCQPNDWDTDGFCDNGNYGATGHGVNADFYCEGNIGRFPTEACRCADYNTITSQLDNRSFQRQTRSQNYDCGWLGWSTCTRRWYQDCSTRCDELGILVCGAEYGPFG